MEKDHEFIIICVKNKKLKEKISNALLKTKGIEFNGLLFGINLFSDSENNANYINKLLSSRIEKNIN